MSNSVCRLDVIVPCDYRRDYGPNPCLLNRKHNWISCIYQEKTIIPEGFTPKEETSDE